jgi:Fe-S-cluster containining protein
LPLVRTGLIPKKDLVTLRRGERVHDPIAGELRPSPEEMVKIRERKPGGCVFYDAPGKACTIYEHRPIQCAALKCWDPSEFMTVYKSPKLTRQDIVENGVLVGLISAHEERCAYERMEQDVMKIEKEGEKAVQRILDLLKFDYELRPFVTEKTGVPLEEMDFLFGRPFTETIPIFGLKVIREPDGTFFLTRADGSARPVR